MFIFGGVLVTHPPLPPNAYPALRGAVHLRQVRLLLRADAALKELRKRSDSYEAPAAGGQTRRESPVAVGESRNDKTTFLAPWGFMGMVCLSFI